MEWAHRSSELGCLHMKLLKQVLYFPTRKLLASWNAGRSPSVFKRRLGAGSRWLTLRTRMERQVQVLCRPTAPDGFGVVVEWTVGTLWPVIGCAWEKAWQG